MKEIYGANIWRHHAAGKWIVVSVNGTVRHDGMAVMGKGIALQAKKRFPSLPVELGAKIKSIGSHVFLFPEYKVISFPVKEHWCEPATLELIEQSCRELIKLWEGNADEVVSIRPGCGLGRLAWTTVKPILEKYLDDRFTIVDWGG